MPRIKLQLPGTFSFTTLIPVRITDLNYGGHVGNDTILSIIHEARIQYLAQFGYNELRFASAGLIMSDVAIEFKNEVFYGDQIRVSVAAAPLSSVSFELFYKLEKDGDGKLAAVARTGMVCFDYLARKITAIPAEAKDKMFI